MSSTIAPTETTAGNAPAPRPHGLGTGKAKAPGAKKTLGTRGFLAFV
jgi:hypothetical protein